jgi:hypothetical protein
MSWPKWLLRTRNLLEAQGYDVRENKVYQDNHSTMLLEKNGRGSSSKRTRHINVRYFFVTDRIKSDEMSVEDVAQQAKWSAIFSQNRYRGKLFRKFRDNIMNVKG